MYKDLLHINDVPNQRHIFESKMNDYLQKGIKMVEKKGII
jgi:pseudouridine-5'-phosphate glycosidase